MLKINISNEKPLEIVICCIIQS